ncbi:MAG: VWA domain-containing protein [Azospirillaceae bacterium]|nr:VWA domain-containing protein [Azospirillaceae bacterium]
MSDREPAVSGSTGVSSPPAVVDAFLQDVAALAPLGSGRRLIFAMDATASREPTWGRACVIQAEMFDVAARLGGLAVQLVYYRGAECRASAWLAEPTALRRLMGLVSCQSGETQIGRVLGHTLVQARKERVGALVFVGDCIEEPADPLYGQAGALGIMGVPVFLFHEGRDRTAFATFQQIARLSGGACCRFDANSADQLRHLLGAVAAYVAGGWPAFEAYRAGKPGPVALLSRQAGPI